MTITNNHSSRQQLLHVDNVYFAYDKEDKCIYNVSLALLPGKLLCLTGDSGSGKSTLGRLMSGAMEPESGDIRLAGNGSDKKLTAEERIRLVGMVEAHPEVQLFADSVAEEIAFGLKNRGMKREEVDKRVGETLELIDLPAEKYAERHPLSLSGGERRMVAIGVYAALQFPFYIFDEPTAGLDWRARQRFEKIVAELLQQGSGVLWITHDVEAIEGLEFEERRLE